MASISECAAGLGITVNAKKTKNMLTENHQHEIDMFFNQNKIDNVEEFTYLGSSVHYLGDMDHELSFRIGKVSATFNQLGKMWTNQKFFLRLAPMCCQHYYIIVKHGT